MSLNSTLKWSENEISCYGHFTTIKKKKQILEQETHSPPDKSGHMEIMKTQVLHVK